LAGGKADKFIKLNQKDGCKNEFSCKNNIRVSKET
jgi:hypothetical protein